MSISTENISASSTPATETLAPVSGKADKSLKGDTGWNGSSGRAWKGSMSVEPVVAMPTVTTVTAEIVRTGADGAAPGADDVDKFLAFFRQNREKWWSFPHEEQALF